MSLLDEHGSATRVAARNNAEWCDILCRTHGVPGRFDPDAWVDPQRTPPFYPDAVTLDPAAVDERILERVDTLTPGCSIKDSFATLDLSSFGFEVVHEAEWIHREPRSAPNVSDTAMRWTAVVKEPDLIEWEAAWDVDGAHRGRFRPALLHNPFVKILGGYIEGSVAAGAIVNRTRDVVGVSNLFTKAGDLDGAWSGCLAYVDRLSPDSAVVGYETADELAAAHRQGFVSVGRLRVWLKE